MNVQEQIEKAWKAGFEKAMANAYCDERDEYRGVWSLEGDGFKKALIEYINKEALT